ncbi:MAG: hypothetical protein RSC85_02095 [Bacilli bacterium]
MSMPMVSTFAATLSSVYLDSTTIISGSLNVVNNKTQGKAETTVHQSVKGDKPGVGLQCLSYGGNYYSLGGSYGSASTTNKQSITHTRGHSEAKQYESFHTTSKVGKKKVLKVTK